MTRKKEYLNKNLICINQNILLTIYYYYLVIFLTVYHFYLGSLLNKFKFDQNKKSSKFYRYINEIPTLLLILIVFVVIFKPL